MSQADFIELQPHVLLELIKLSPTVDEIAMLAPFEADKEHFAAPERFMWEINQINRFAERIKAIYVRLMMDEWVEDAKRQLKRWADGCKQMKSSKKFISLLQVLIPAPIHPQTLILFT